ncbi:MAG: PAS domain S-box protein [Spirochaetia bacterium]
MSTKKNSDNDMLGREMGSLKKRVTDLEASEQRLRATLYGIGDGIIVTDAGGCLLQMNPVAEALTGCSEAEARAHPVDEVFRTINEQTRDSSESPVTRVLREGTVVGLANHGLLVARDGTERPVAGSIAPIRERQEAVAGVVLVFRDHTEARRAQDREAHLKQVLLAIRNVNQLITTETDPKRLIERACENLTETLRAGENKMKSIFRAAPIGIGVVPNRVLLDVNERFCEITGYSKPASWAAHIR